MENLIKQYIAGFLKNYNIEYNKILLSSKGFDRESISEGIVKKTTFSIILPTHDLGLDTEELENRLLFDENITIDGKEVKQVLLNVSERNINNTWYRTINVEYEYLTII